MKKIMLFILLFSLNGCIGTIVGTAVDVTAEVVKAPFKIGGAVIDAVSDDDDEISSEETKD
ncbi:hypothetical protein D8Y20_08650 [Mariprofundus sp. EBB-1]|uniref:NF038104 family lipoprotein n=1 Tax=Mariprofundus sp. EBB-1 TaxID=2650971 RepID=UPI000EF2933B|nr:NF038104 family lipoprotein [Mariprofundus sp. EBB-1]RLL51744.1 hypothetical protein D8Y20_08650 [Mariprofundus sp. EBB-1]